MCGVVNLRGRLYSVWGVIILCVLSNEQKRELKKSNEWKWRHKMIFTALKKKGYMEGTKFKQ